MAKIQNCIFGPLSCISKYGGYIYWYWCFTRMTLLVISTKCMRAMTTAVFNYVCIKEMTPFPTRVSTSSQWCHFLFGIIVETEVLKLNNINAQVDLMHYCQALNQIKFILKSIKFWNWGICLEHLVLLCSKLGMVTSQAMDKDNTESVNNASNSWWRSGITWFLIN